MTNKKLTVEESARLTCEYEATAVCDIFPAGTLGVLGSLKGKTAEEMGKELLEEEQRIEK